VNKVADVAQSRMDMLVSPTILQELFFLSPKKQPYFKEGSSRYLVLEYILHTTSLICVFFPKIKQ
jgi:hypothetical protein